MGIIKMKSHGMVLNIIIRDRYMTSCWTLSATLSTLWDYSNFIIIAASHSAINLVVSMGNKQYRHRRPQNSMR